LYIMADSTNEIKDADPPKKNTEKDQTSDSQSAKSHTAADIVRVLDDYFEHDANLRKQYEQERSIDELYQLKLIQAINPDKDLLMAAIQKCKKLTLDESQKKVRAKTGRGRTILILRDLPRDVQHGHIKNLLESEELVSQLESRVKEIRPELNETWFVRFATQDDCLTAAEWLTFHGKLNGQKVKCRVKSVLQSSTYNPVGNVTPSNNTQFMDNSSMHPYDPQHQGFYSSYPPSPGFGMSHGWPNPQISPNFQSNVPPIQRRNSGRKNSQQRRNSGRGRGRGQFNKQGSKYGRGSPNMTGKRRGSRKYKDDNDDNVFYEGSFQLLERRNFEAAVNEASKNSNEPVKPKELGDFPDIVCYEPKMGFSLKPLQGSTISPMPESQKNHQAPPELSLDSSKKDSKKKSQSTNFDKKTGMKDSKGDKKTVTVDNDDKKEEEKDDKSVAINATVLTSTAI